MSEPLYSDLYRLKNKAINPFSLKTLKEAIDITFIENDPVVFEFTEDEQTNKHLFF